MFLGLSLGSGDFFFHWKFLVLILGVALVASVSIDQGHVS